MGDIPVLTAMITSGVTVTVTHRVRPGRERAFREWAAGVAAASGAEVTVIEPADTARGEYLLVARFNDAAALRAWEASADYPQWLARLAPFVRGARLRSVVPTLDAWYTIAYRPDLPLPARSRTYVVSVLGIYPLLLVFAATLAPEIGWLPSVLRPLVTSAILLTAMQYVIMPRLTRAFVAWLYPAP